MSKLWKKNASDEPNTLVENYTVGIDHILDQQLVIYDAQASIAHAEMLSTIGILTNEEKNSLVTGLKKIIKLSEEGEFAIEKSDEDCHTAIENFLTKECGEAGKKIHTGRSRNDQVLVALRLYMKEKLAFAHEKTEALIVALEKKAKGYEGAVMPGYTHMQQAMPSSADMWLSGIADALKDDLLIIEATKKIIDQNPLGSVVGYSEKSFGLDRKMTTEILGFAKVQENPLYCALSRGKFEILTLQALSGVMFDIGKLSTDLMLFTMKELGFAKLPGAFTTGSSAMPQKHNYDVCELMRANCASYLGFVINIQNIIEKLPSGYNRDFQITKEPFMKGLASAINTIEIATLVVDNLVMNTDAMKKACGPELYATEEAYALVKEKKISFRDAYKIVGDKYSRED